MKKRLLAFLLSIAMIVGVMPTALAEEADAESSANNEPQTVSVEDIQEADVVKETDKSDTVRYTVLILDASGSMSGTPATVQKAAAKKFCKSITSASGTNYVGIVKIESSSSKVCDFTTDLSSLENYIDHIPANSGTNTNQALTIAGTMLDGATAEGAIKNIVLCSDGLPESGETTPTGKYTSANSSYYYRYGNACIATADALKEKSYNIYTLGFFHSLSGSNLSFGSMLMKDIAGNESQYYEVTDVDKLEFTFGDIADTLIDSDGDGLCDDWETSGIDLDKDGKIDLHLEQMGADPNVPDLFVEVDWMVRPEKKFLFITTQNELSLAPSSEAMRMVYDAFKSHGIRLHIDAGADSIDFVTGKRWGEISGGNEIPYEKNFDLGNNNSHWTAVAESNFSEARRNVFRYAMFVNTYGNDTSNGIANGIPGQYFIVANQEWVRNTGDTGVAGTFMHELGHTLGLSHGGLDDEGNVDYDVHYQPNYLSIMNYLFQTRGLLGNVMVNYSDYDLPTLDEGRLSETSGFDPNGQTENTNIGTVIKNGNRTINNISRSPIDFNNSGNIETDAVSFDLNGDGSDSSKLYSSKDWERIVFCGGTIGTHEDIIHIKGMSPDENNLKSEELTFEEALNNNVLSDSGTGALEPLGPYTLFVDKNNQHTYIRVKNMGAESSEYSLEINQNEITNALTQTIVLEASENEIKYTDIEIPINSVGVKGSYQIHAVLKSKGHEDVVLDIPISIEDPSKEDLVELKDAINDGNTDLPDIVKEEYIDIINEVTPTPEPSTPSHYHSYDAGKVTKEVSCTEKGVKTYTCSCGYSYTEEIPALGHKEEVIPAVAPTCTETGLTEGSKCSVCGEIIKSQETVDALGHKEVTDPAVKATRTANGKTAGSHCSVCGEIITAQKTVYKASKITLSKTSYKYNGKKHTPKAIVKNSKGKIIDSSNYTVKYQSGRKKIGKYKVTVTFNGDTYKGSKTLYFRIKR